MGERPGGKDPDGQGEELIMELTIVNPPPRPEAHQPGTDNRQ
ncbi:MAG TPA: hypothetical protein VF995_09210 [Actinomycetota bacterium]